MLFLGCIFKIIFLISATDVGFKNIEMHTGKPKNSLNGFCGVASLFTNFSPILEFYAAASSRYFKIISVPVLNTRMKSSAVSVQPKYEYGQKYGGT